MVIGTPTVLNLIPGGVMKVIHVNQVNENIEIQFRIMNGAQPFNVPEGVSCTIRGTKGDNFGYAADVAVTAGSNIVTVTLTEQLTAVAGAGNIFELVFVGASDDMKVSTENFLLDVERAALGEDTVISDSDLAYADQVLDQLQSVGAVNAQVQQNKANIAAEITRATAAEQTLQQNINAEATARQAADNTLQSNINAEASSRATTDASLQSQINQLVAPSGEAPSAAEVQNARIGTDGTVYPTLGDAIRTQNSLVKSQLRKYNTYNMIPQRNDSGTARGITFVSNGDGSYTLSGIATDNAYYRLFDSANSLPFGMEAGKTYKLKINGHDDLVSLQWYDYTLNGISDLKWFASADKFFTISEDAIGALIRLAVRSGTDITTPITVEPIVQSSMTNLEIQDVMNQSMREISNCLSSVPNLIFKIGSISTATGGSATASNRIYEPLMIEDTGIVYAKVQSGASIGLRFYTEASVESYVGYEAFYSGVINISDFVRKHDAKYFRIVMKYDNDADITDVNDLYAYLSLSGVVPYFRREENLVLDLEQGNYYTTPPRYAASTTRCRHKYMIQVDNQVTIESDAGYYYTLREFDADKNFVGFSPDWITGKTTYSRAMNPNVAYILIAFRDSADSTMTPAKMLEIAEHVHISTVDYVDERKYRVSLSTPVMQQKITDNIVIAPTLCAVKFKYESGKQPVPIGWLFRDNQEPYNFYWSSDGINKEVLFSWDKSVTDTGSRTPYEYAFGITYEGDIICAYRGELAYAQGASDANLRKNPIVYKHGDYSHPVVVDFSGSVAPTSWVMNCGYYAENGVVYFCEYTRFHHDYAYVWRISAPYYNPSDWEIVKSFQVSGNQQGFKHCHNIERDPYTGILWLSTGDIPPTDPQYVGTPGIYYSTDDGTTWTTLVEDSEKYCRQLNFIWTKDYVYWGSDSGTYETHYFMRAKRDGNGVIDLNTVEDLFQFYTRSATYHICYSEKPHGILCLEHMDNPSLDPINFYFWDIDQEKMLFIDRCDAIGNGHTGFRCDAINHYPAPNQIGYLCGFSLNQSNIDMPGNKYISDYYTSGYVKRDTDNVGCLNNILVKIEPR